MRTPISTLLALSLLLPLGCSATPDSNTTNASAVDNTDGLDDPALYWVNKERCEPCGFVPPNLVSIDAYANAGGDGTLSVRDFVRAPLARMLADARSATGDFAMISSSYRSYSLQVTVLNNESNNPGIGPCQAAREVAPPGHSEHQLGTAVDLGVSGGKSGAGYLDGFGRTAAGAWIQAHSYEYGFVMSYPDARREAITGYRHEPWHFRYLGPTAAKVAHDNGWSVEEYFRGAHPATADLPMTCTACQADRGALSGCPTNTSTIATCGTGQSAGSNVRCELGLIQCDACVGGLCDTKTAGQDDVCRNGVVSSSTPPSSVPSADAGASPLTGGDTTPASCPAGTYAIWTCSSNLASRTRCVDGKVETQTCPFGCYGMPVGSDDYCE